MLLQVSLLLLANAKKNAIYAAHVDYGPFPASTRLDCIGDFTVTMPILSLTGTSDSPSLLCPGTGYSAICTGFISVFATPS